MNAAAGAVAASLPVEDWMLAAFPSQIHAEAWELRGALDVLWDFFAQAIPKLKLDNDAYGIGLLRLNKIMPAVGEKFVDPADATACWTRSSASSLLDKGATSRGRRPRTQPSRTPLSASARLTRQSGTCSRRQK